MSKGFVTNWRRGRPVHRLELMGSDGAKTERDSAEEYTEALNALALSAGAVLFGVAARYPGDWNFPGYPRAVSVGAVLSRGVLETVKDRPTGIYAYHYRTVNALLDQVAARIVAYIEAAGRRSVHIPASQIIDWERLVGQVSHRELARRAGLGFIGRNNLLVNPRFGAGVRLISILTDMPLVEDTPIDMNCGECRACISVCPAGAIGENREDFDLEKCVDKLRWFKKHLVGHHICGVCIRVCTGSENA